MLPLVTTDLTETPGVRHLPRFPASDVSYQYSRADSAASLQEVVMPRHSYAEVRAGSEDGAGRVVMESQAFAGQQRHVGRSVDETFDSAVAQNLASWYLGKPPLRDDDSTEDAALPGTGLWKKGKASPGLIKALQSLPHRVFVASLTVRFARLVTAVVSSNWAQKT